MKILCYEGFSLITVATSGYLKVYDILTLVKT